MGESDESVSGAEPGVGGTPSGQHCTVCGVPVDTDDWYPVAKERDADGELQIRPFCSEDCRAEWADDASR